MVLFIDSCLALLALSAALWVRPWRALPSGPPWPWWALWVLLPLFWGLDRYTASPLAQPLSGVVLLTLMAGWPLAMLALVPAAVVTMVAGDLPLAEALHRLVWLGAVPGSLALAIGAALRRWMPHHLFIYILGRGFLGTLLACVTAAWIALSLLGQPVPPEFYIARWLGAFGEAFLTGMVVSILVAFHPEWLATYTDRLYLPR